MNLVVRGQGDPRALSAPLRSEILAIDKEQPATGVRTMEQHLGGFYYPESSDDTLTRRFFQHGASGGHASGCTA